MAHGKHTMFHLDISDKSLFFPSLIYTTIMVVVTEIGDKTFFLAAIMAMKYKRSYVWLGQIIAQACMTLISAALGLVAPQMLPHRITHFIAAILFAFFGFRGLREALNMSDNGSELKKVEETITQTQENKELDLMESERISNTPYNYNDQYQYDGYFNICVHGYNSVQFFLQTILNPTFCQALTLTMLAEWGDPSQVSIIVLTATSNFIGVLIGGFLGHVVCTTLAVIGGRFVAARVSEKTVTLVGGFLFLALAIHSFLEHPAD